MTDINYIDGSGLRLADALEIRAGEAVALVGGGGKTSAMFRLAAELASSGGVLVTTTTHMYPPEPEQGLTVVNETALERLIESAGNALASRRVVVVARGLNQQDGRLAGIDPDWVPRLRERLGSPTILVEADGSKGRPLKAPAGHEPVIPACASLVVPVVGLSVIGRPLTPESVHRPELVAALAGAKLGDIVDAELVARVLAAPEGGGCGVPRGARIIPLLNQADNDDDRRRSEGRSVACRLIARGMGRVVIGAVRQREPVREVVTASKSTARVTAVVLAAGLGRRMGRLKLALPLAGKALLRHAVDAALASEADEVIVVLGHGADELEAHLPAAGIAGAGASTARLQTLLNPDYAAGQSSSIKAAVRALSSGAEAVLFLLGDQPTISAEVINAVIRAFRGTGAPLVQPDFRGVKGHPVLFARSLFAELSLVAGDEGGREVLGRHLADRVTVPLDLDPPGDVDTAADYERLAGGFGPGLRR